MRCSRCSEHVLPVVAIDIDGTLADYHTHFLEFLARWVGCEPNYGYEGRQAFRDWVQESYGIDVTTFRNAKLAYRQGGLKRLMPKYPMARELVSKLSSRTEVWLTTTRPWERYDRVDPDTREWLRRQGIPFDALLYSGNKIKELTQQVSSNRIVAVLDDQVSQLDLAAHLINASVPILRRTRFNRASEYRGSQVLNLTDAYTMINARVASWERNYK
jgi:uncharacterized HAD superfamily protein